MKKMLLVLFVVSSLFIGVGNVAAANVLYASGDFAVMLPVRDSMNAVSLYDLVNGKGYIGLESTIIKYKSINLNGGIISKDAQGAEIKKTPAYISLDFVFASTSPEIAKSKIGIWVGEDFDYDTNKRIIAGIKASMPLW